MLHNLNIPGYKSEQELDAYQFIVETLRPSTIIEVGSSLGRLTYTLANTVKEWDGIVIAVDLWHLESLTGNGYSLELAENGKQTREQFDMFMKDFDNIITIQGDANLMETFDNHTADLVIQDIDNGFEKTTIDNILINLWNVTNVDGCLIGSHYWPHRTDMREQILKFSNSINKLIKVIDNEAYIWKINK